MKINVRAGKIEKHKTDAAIILLFEKEKPGRVAERVDKALGGMISRLIKKGDVKLKTGTVHLLYPEGRIRAERLLLVGLGNRSEFTPNRLRQAAGKAASSLRSAGARDITFITDGVVLDAEELGQALAEGTILGLYRFLKYKTGEENGLARDVRTITLSEGIHRRDQGHTKRCEGG